MKMLLLAGVTVALLAAGAAGAQPAPRDPGQDDRGHASMDGGGCFNGERDRDCGQRRSFEQKTNRHFDYRDGHYEDRDNRSGPGAGNVLGFVLGAAIAGSMSDRDYYIAHRNDRGWRNRCRSAYRNFDYRTGTYATDDGYRHYCLR